MAGFFEDFAKTSCFVGIGMISRRPLQPTHDGMTVLELLLAVTMLLVFTGVVVMVSGTIIRFLSPINQGNANGVVRSNGLLIDQMELRRTMHRLVSVLEQPGITRAQLLGFQSGVPAIAHTQSANPDVVCVVDPIGVPRSNPLDRVARRPLL